MTDFPSLSYTSTREILTRRAIHKLLIYFKIGNNFCPSYLVDLLPLQVSERTTYSLRTASNYSLLASRTERFNRSFFPSTTTLYYYLDFAIDRFNAIFHTRLRLDTCALNYYLYKIGCKESPVCFCGFYSETIKHFLLECPLYSAPRIPLLLAYLLTGGFPCLKHK